MKAQQNFKPLSCSECVHGAGLSFDFSMAFQPIVNLHERNVYAHEALVRGVNNESAGAILGRIDYHNRYRFDQACRVKAIELSARLNLNTRVSINFMPNAVYRAELCIRTTLECARLHNIPTSHIIFEFTEGEQIKDLPHVSDIVDEYKKQGFLVAIDDFGAGYSGLNLLAELETDIIKLDMQLVRELHHHKTRQAIIKAITEVCRELDITVIAEGVETLDEAKALLDLGIYLQQGYYFSKPLFQSLFHPQADIFSGL
ncbi:EAL domain-containing protein [Hahella sp. KA22]|uniref:EAL domain-containing protein n=1 Tax=Hahella sp. KA22 TaxID=1628392 RepID=UPI000FDDEB3C|nr:EAL domain-containing protein [Hahella sp. KA22]AZZ89714.1 EAL domain-containing protein [Hahella sp. KA22]QAY53084.1 EAL domain-containing protein [Hahella sp. KA22]